MKNLTLKEALGFVAAFTISMTASALHIEQAERIARASAATAAPLFEGSKFVQLDTREHILHQMIGTLREEVAAGEDNGTLERARQYIRRFPEQAARYFREHGKACNETHVGTLIWIERGCPERGRKS